MLDAVQKNHHVLQVWGIRGLGDLLVLRDKVVVKGSGYAAFVSPLSAVCGRWVSRLGILPTEKPKTGRQRKIVLDVGCRGGKRGVGCELMVWLWVNVHWVETENGMWEVVRKACISLLGLASLPPWHQLLWIALQRDWPCSGLEPGPVCMPAAGPCGFPSGTILRLLFLVFFPEGCRCFLGTPWCLDSWEGALGAQLATGPTGEQQARKSGWILMSIKVTVWPSVWIFYKGITWKALHETIFSDGDGEDAPKTGALNPHRPDGGARRTPCHLGASLLCKSMAWDSPAPLAQWVQ